MAAGEEVEEDNHSDFWVFNDGMDDLFDHRHCKDYAPNMGSVQYPRNFKGKEKK